MKKAKYNATLMSPKGDVQAYNEGELRRAFPRTIKSSGRMLQARRHLPFTRDKMEGDTPRISVRKADPDEVV